MILINIGTFLAILAFNKAIAAPAPMPAPVSTNPESIVSGDEAYPLPVAPPSLPEDVQIKRGQHGITTENGDLYRGKRQVPWYVEVTGPDGEPIPVKRQTPPPASYFLPKGPDGEPIPVKREDTLSSTAQANANNVI